MTEASILIDKHHVVTIPKNLREILQKNGWEDGKVFIIFDDKTNSLRIVQAEKMTMLAKKGIAEREIWNGPVIRPSLSPFEEEIPPREALLMVAGDRKKTEKAYL